MTHRGLAAGWRIRWTRTAEKDILGIDPAAARRIVLRLEPAAPNPPRFFERLAGRDEWKLRIGDWRLLAWLSFETRTVLAARVDHRRRVYRP